MLGAIRDSSADPAAAKNFFAGVKNRGLPCGDGALRFVEGDLRGSRINRILDDSQDRISSIVGDAAEITRITRGQAQKVDRVFTDAVDRLRVQVIRADHLLTGALEVLEDTGSKVRKTVTGPVTQVAAVLKGIKVGLDFIRGQQQRRRSDRPRS